MQGASFVTAGKPAMRALLALALFGACIGTIAAESE
jgi:hypothetical protein